MDTVVVEVATMEQFTTVIPQHIRVVNRKHVEEILITACMIQQMDGIGL